MCTPGLDIRLQFALGNVWTRAIPFVLAPEPMFHVLVK